MGFIALTPEIKKCSSCGEHKPLYDYSKDKRRISGLVPSCKACAKKKYLEKKEWIKSGKPPKTKPPPKNKGPRHQVLTRELILSQLDYDRDSGTFTWKVNKLNQFAIVGMPAGKINLGYGIIKLFGKDRRRAHLVWIVETGSPPPKGLYIDHIDRNKANDHISNLRLATHQQNTMNRVRKVGNKSSKYQGVHLNEYKTWTAAIGVDGKNIYLGAHKREVDAARAYNEAAKKYHGEFAYLNTLEA